MPSRGLFQGGASLMSMRSRRPGRRPRTPSFLHQNLYGSFELPALLDTLNSPRDPAHIAVRSVVERMTKDGPTRHAVRLFNRHFGKKAIPLQLRLARRDGRITAWPALLPSADALALWWVLTTSGPLRIRRCLECQRYFFDRTRNSSKMYCTATCQTRTTSRRYRSSR